MTKIIKDFKSFSITKNITRVSKIKLSANVLAENEEEAKVKLERGDVYFDTDNSVRGEVLGCDSNGYRGRGTETTFSINEVIEIEEVK